MHTHLQNYDICWSYTFITKRKVCRIYKVYVWSVTVTLIAVVSSNESRLRNRG
jgi:hypothetical protein